MICNLKKIAKKRGFKLNQITTALGVCSVMTAHWAKVGIPPKYYDDLCGLLNCTIDELYTIEPTVWEWEESA